MNDHAGWTQEGACVRCGSRDSTQPCELPHQHKYLPSAGCSWKCACGASFIACICGQCEKTAPVMIIEPTLPQGRNGEVSQLPTPVLTLDDEPTRNIKVLVRAPRYIVNVKRFRGH